MYCIHFVGLPQQITMKLRELWALPVLEPEVGIEGVVGRAPPEEC